MQMQESNITLLKDLFGPTLVDKNGKVVQVEDVLGGGKFIGIYVGAEWASACQPFVKALVDTYGKVNEKTMLPVFEVVYVSADKSQEQFDGYMKDKPWVAVSFTELRLRKKVMTIYKAATLPKLILLSPSGKVLTDDEKWLTADPNGLKFPWEGPSDQICVIH